MQDDSLAYSVACGYCGARRGEACMVLVPKGNETVATFDTDMTYFQRQRRARELNRPLDHAHRGRLDAAKHWQHWHAGINVNNTNAMPIPALGPSTAGANP
jgi:hypothetical protein